MEIEPREEASIAEIFGFRGKKKKTTTTSQKSKRNVELVTDDSPPTNDNNGADDANTTAPNINNVANEGDDANASNSSGRVRISSFDFSIESFFRYMDTVAKLCGEEQSDDDPENSEIQRFSSSVTFLREWRDFKYPPRSIRFGYKLGSSESSVEENCGAINLPQFSSATVPKCKREEQLGDAKYQESRDFLMHAGGPVWALDWCPLIHEKPDCSIKCEFIAVATHPPGSSYHKIGAPLTGRGIIQIWCILSIREQDEEASHVTENRKKRPKKDGGTNDKSTQVKRPRGRPRKSPKETAVDDTDSEAQYMPALAVLFPENSYAFPAPDGIHGNSEETFPPTHKSKRGSKRNEASNEKSAQLKKPRGRPRKNSKEVTIDSSNCENQSVQVLAIQGPEDSTELISSDSAHGNCKEPSLQQSSTAKKRHAKKDDSACNAISETHVKSTRLKTNHSEGGYNQDISQPLLTRCENESSHQPQCSSELGPVAATDSSQGHLALPRLVSCLAHNGKVAWDVKWRPPNTSDSISKHRMGYLAVLLGNGSLEVWEVPLPRVLRSIYKHKEGTDPRFIKLKPVFKCSMLKRGGKQSIPLTLEWSVMPPHDYLLAGCHDGTVALWKFSANASSKCEDTRPVLCFSGDTAPIRAVAWAPFEEGDQESSNIIATAGHEGLKFWDLRDPFHPLRSVQPVPRVIYSLDWLPKPSCIIMSFEDGTMKTFSLVKAASEVPVNGKAYNGKKQPWLHSSSLSSYAIWSVQVSRSTGMVAYCGVDGAAIRYQLTTKAVETEGSHNRVPYFLCGSITEEESSLVINSPESNTPFPLKKSNDKVRHAQSFRELLLKTRKCGIDEMAKASNPNSQTLALCDGDDLGLDSASEDIMTSEEQPKRPKSSSSNKKKPAESKALVGRDDPFTSSPAEDTEKSDFGNVPEVLPSKMVALHRVRWNMNKGSERWLCFGGAGGIVRCQEIVFSNVDKKWALKW